MTGMTGLEAAAVAGVSPASARFTVLGSAAPVRAAAPRNLRREIPRFIIESSLLHVAIAASRMQCG